MVTLIRISQLVVPACMLMAVGCNWPQGGGLSSWAPQRVPPPGTNSYSNADYYRGPAVTSSGIGVSPVNSIGVAPVNPSGIGVSPVNSIGAAPVNNFNPAPYGVQPANYQNWSPPGPAESPAQSVRAAIETAPTPNRMQLKGMPAVDLTASYAPDGTRLPGGAESSPYPNSSLVASAPYGPNMVRGQLAENPAPPTSRLPQASFMPMESTASSGMNAPTTRLATGPNQLRPSPVNNREPAKAAPVSGAQTPASSSNTGTPVSTNGPTELKDLPWQSPR